MGEWLGLVIVGGIALLTFCVYLLSAQLERSAHLAVSVIVSNQNRILEKLEQLLETHALDARARAAQDPVVAVDRRIVQRRQAVARAEDGKFPAERRRSPGRRREDLACIPG